ncbi:hypothetical protein [Sagittula sp. P11]|nr:hypothetical protein [Sagittula sp. P11]
MAEQDLLRRLYGARLAGFDPLGRLILWGPTRIPKISPKPKPEGD